LQVVDPFDVFWGEHVWLSAFCYRLGSKSSTLKEKTANAGEAGPPLRGR
jgi:hypothetical protein